MCIRDRSKCVGIISENIEVVKSSCSSEKKSKLFIRKAISLTLDTLKPSIVFFLRDFNNIISLLWVFGRALLNIDGNDTLPFLSILFTNVETNKSMVLYGLSWDIMGVNGLTIKNNVCSYFVPINFKDDA